MSRIDFRAVKKDFDRFERQREKVIHQSRQVIQTSKKIIYCIHRKDMGNTSRYAEQINQQVGKLKRFKNPKLTASGSYKVAMQEYVEALCYLEFVKNKRLPSYTKMRVDFEYYLLGICDFTGELVRRAVSMGIDEQFEEVKDIRDFVNSIYNELLKFDFRSSELRKKADSIRWDLKKLDEMVLQLKLKKK